MSKLGLVFPGQGAQYVGMGKDFYRDFQVARETFAEADQVLGFPMTRLCFEGPKDKLDRTVYTQTAVLTMDVVALRVFLDETGMSPHILAGHSLGEYAALHAAGAMSFADALRLVFVRGKYQEEAIPVNSGGMAALIGLDETEVEEVCAEIRGLVGGVFPSIINGSDQIVISGYMPAVDAAMQKVKQKGGKAVKLSISVPCHCPLMDDAAQRFRLELDGIELRECRVPVIPNFNPYSVYCLDTMKDLLMRQINSPIRWKDCVEKIRAEGTDLIVELGPKKVLSGLIKRIDKAARVANVEDAPSLAKTIELINAVRA